MSQYYEYPTPEEIKLAVAEVIDNYYTLLVDYLNRMFREKDLHIDQVLGEVSNVKANLLEHRKVEDTINNINAGVGEIKQQMLCIKDVLKQLDQHLAQYYQDLAKNIAAEWWSQAPEDFKVIWTKIKNFLWQYFEVDPGGVTQFFADIGNAIGSAISSALSSIVNALKSAFQSVGNLISGAIEKVWSGLQDLGNIISDVISGIIDWIKKLVDWIKKIADYLSKIPEFIDNFIDWIVKFFKELWEQLTGTVKWIWDNIKKFVEDPWEWIKNNIISPLWKGLSWLKDRIVAALSYIYEKLETIVRNFIMAISNVASKVYLAIRSVVSFFVNKLEEAIGWVINSLIKPAMTTLASKLGEIARKSLQEALASRGAKGEFWILFHVPALALPYIGALMGPPLIIEHTSDLIKEVEAEVDAAPLEVGIKAKLKAWLGSLTKWIGSLGKDFSRNMLLGFTVGMALATLDPFKYLVRPVAKEFFTPAFQAAIGIDAFFQLPGRTEILEFMRRALPDKILRELGLTEVRGVLQKKTAGGAITLEYKPYIKWSDAQKYVSNILKVYGLPDKFLEVYKIGQLDFYIKFIDRFGKIRSLPLSPVFELPTHSELLRMTQRDVFPGVDIMQGVASLRGWAPDITVLSYLMTFKYPSFSNLWKFWMRALSGMLWLHIDVNDPIRKIFSEEAREIGAGIPRTPLEIQRALAAKGADAVRAIESAIGAYLKWLEYSNFSWFTPNTEMYGVQIGKEIYDKLGGWVADSWLMADIAADIPTKIDMRWMSRYGIFILMGERFGAFETFEPMVTKLPKLLDKDPASPIQVDLRWFSKLLQATGLHPAWVPIVTVAENIMAISDEMTLLRTGWINFFKEGLMDFDRMEKSLAGLLVASYQVGYFDTVEKVWKSGWINLPIRWLPHERRLLALRALMDRTLDLFREYYKFLIRMVGRNIISWEEATKRLTQIVGTIVDSFYRKTIAKILGVKESEVPGELIPSIEADYLAAWEPYVKELQEEEKYERARIYLRYLVSRLADRFAQGYITKEELNKALDVFRVYAKATDHEVKMVKLVSDFLATYYERRLASEAYINMYKRLRITKDELLNRLKELGLKEQVAEWLIEKYARTYVPTLSQIATISEIVPEVLEVEFRGKKFYEAMIDFYDLTDVEKKIWRLYIERKPYKSDFDKVMTNVRSLLSYGADVSLIKQILGVEEKVEFTEWLKQWGIDAKEWTIIGWQAKTDEYERVWREAHLSVSRMVSLAEYVPELRNRLESYLRTHGIPEEIVDIWVKYLSRRTTLDDFKRILSNLITLASYGATWELLATVLDLEKPEELKQLLASYGYSDKEISLLELRAKTEELVRVWREAHLSVSRLATFAELVPEARKDLEEYLRAHSIPEKLVNYWITYVSRKTTIDDFRRVLSNLVSLMSYGATVDTLVQILGLEKPEEYAQLLASYGYTDRERKLIELRAKSEEFERAWRESHLSISRLAGWVEYLPDAITWLEDYMKKHLIPDDVIAKWKKYAFLRSIASEANLARSRAIELLSIGAGEGLIAKVLGLDSIESLKEWGISTAEWDVIKRVAKLESYKDVWKWFYVSPDTLRDHIELMPENLDKLTTILSQYEVPEEWISYWKTYLWRKAVRNDFGYVRTAFRNLLEKGIDITKYDWDKIYEQGKSLYDKVSGFLSKFGVTADEFGLWYVAAFAETIIPKELTVGFLATLSEYVPIPEDLVREVLAWYKIPEKWWQYIILYIKARPLRDELKKLASKVYEAWVKGVDLGEYGKRALTLLRTYGWTDQELDIMKLTAEIDRIIRGRKERWPSPDKIVTIAEYVPEARKLLDQSFEAYDVPPEVREVYRRYSYTRPWMDELRRLVSEVITDYARGVIDDEHMKRFLEWLKQYGFEDEEIKFIYNVAALRKKRYQLLGYKMAQPTTAVTAVPTAPPAAPAPTAPAPAAPTRKIEFVW